MPEQPNNTEISQKMPGLSDITGPFPYRLALAGGWIDQPFVSQSNPQPPGSMVVVSVVPEYRFMDRAGLGSSTRQAAQLLWGSRFPEASNADLVRSLYQAENEGKPEPSGSQDMIGMIYPGINRLDYDARHEGGYFPSHIETCLDPAAAHWLETVLHILPVSQRPPGYSPLGIKNLVPAWIQRLGQTGRDCFEFDPAHGPGRSGKLVKRVHGMLGSDPATHPPPPNHPDRSKGYPAPLPEALPRSHVFGLRRRLPLCCIGTTRSGLIWVSGQVVLMVEVIVCGAFDDLRLQHMHFLHAAARVGRVKALLWSDMLFQQI